MIRLPRPADARQRENTIALINIVFLMLIFFLVAGTLTPPLDADVRLITTERAIPADPPEALFITAQGTLRWRGRETGIDDAVAGQGAADDGGAPALKVAADRKLPAEKLIDIVGELRAAGAGKIVIITERASR